MFNDDVYVWGLQVEDAVTKLPLLCYVMTNDIYTEDWFIRHVNVYVAYYRAYVQLYWLTK